MLGPTLALAIAGTTTPGRSWSGLAALAILLIGSHRRLQAPIVLGAATLVALAIDKLGPQAVRLPRWLMLAFAGSVLLWVGTTFERRRDDVMRRPAASSAWADRGPGRGWGPPTHSLRGRARKAEETTVPHHRWWPRSRGG